MKYGWPTTCLISSNASRLILVYLKSILLNVILFKGANVCDRIYHIPRYYFTKPINRRTSFWEVGGIIFLLIIYFIYRFYAITCYLKTQIFHFGFSEENVSKLQSSPLSFSLFMVSSNLCTWFVWSTSVNIKRSSIYTRINLNI